MNNEEACKGCGCRLSLLDLKSWGTYLVAFSTVCAPKEERADLTSLSLLDAWQSQAHITLSWIISLFVAVVVQLLSRVRLFAASWTTASQASLSFTISWSLLPSHPLSPTSPPALNLSQHQGLFQWVGSLHQVSKVLEFSFRISSFSEYSRLIFFRIDWFDLFAI